MFRLKSPLYAQIELTSCCNLNCANCYNEERPEKPIIQPLDRFSEIAQELARNDVFAVTLTGGEPLVVRDRLYKTARILADNNMDVSLNSNITLLTEDDVQRLGESGVTSVMTSLFSYDSRVHDETTGVEGSHQRTINALELLVKQGILTTVNMVVSQRNKTHVYDTGRFVSSLGIDSFSTAQIIPSNSQKVLHLEQTLTQEDVLNYLEDLNKVRQETGLFVKLSNPLPYCLVWDEKPHLSYLVETSSCMAGRTVIQIAPNGDVKPCPMVNASYGNVLEEGLEQIWERLSEWDENRYIPEECKPCEITNVCKGACRGEAQRTNGSLNSVSPYLVNPVKLGRKQINSLTKGTRLRAVRNIKARKENDLYVLFADYQYMLTDERTAKFISALSSEEIVMDGELINDPKTFGILNGAYNAGMLREVKNG
nr:hypothetical protein [Nanoarchaeum sp.]